MNLGIELNKIIIRPDTQAINIILKSSEVSMRVNLAVKHPISSDPHLRSVRQFCKDCDGSGEQGQLRGDLVFQHVRSPSATSV